MLRSRSGVFDIYQLEVVRVLYLVKEQIVILINHGGIVESALGMQTPYEDFP